jgi:predicted site-specific integrase-resolvase
MGIEIGLNSHDPPNKSLLRPDELAAFFRISVKTVHRWRAEGHLQGVKERSGLRIYRQSVIEQLDRNGTGKNW